MKTAFSWLHLSDLHYGLKGQDCLWPNLRQPFLDDLTELRERCGPWDAVLFTGDLVQSGASAQFEKLHNEVLGPLWDKLRELGSGDAVLLAVPGNHDLFRPNPHVDNPAAERLLEPGGYEKIKEKFWDLPDGSYRRVVTDAFGAWREWWDKAPHRPDTIRNGLLPGDFSATLEKDGRRIGIVGLNTAFLQLGGGDYKERLVWDARQLHGVCDGGIDVWTRDHDACLLLSHHGPDWLTPEARQHGETEMAPAGRFAAHLYGHMHETRLVYIRQGGSRHAVRLLQGGSVFGMDKFGEPPITQRSHGYTAGRIEFDGDTATLHLWPRVATDKTGGWRFIPDHVNAELVSDEGTAPDSIPTRKQAGSPANPVATEIPAAPVGAGSPALPHSTLPIRRPFYGRSKELADIAKFLAPEDRSWGIAIDGPGGMGKTALALEAAHRAPAELYPLKLWVSAKNRELRPEGEQRLHDHKVDDFHALLNELGLALGRDDIPKARPEDRPGLIRHALSGRRALLVLDNLESCTPEERRRRY